MGIGATGRMHELTPHSKVIALLGLAAFAASLAGCGGHTNATSTATASSAVTPAPSVAPSLAPGGAPTAAPTIDTEVVTIPTLAKVQADVASSGLTQLDKNRFAAFIDDHQDRANAYVDKTVREVINLQISYEVALRLAAQADADDKLHKAMLAKLIASTVTLVSEDDRKVVLHFAFQNLSDKEIKKLELGLEFDDAKTNARIAMSEVHLTRNIPAHGRIAFDYPMRYYRFSEDAGPLMAAKGKPKTLVAQVKEIKYADGTDAGFDD